MASISFPEPICDIVIPIWNQPELTQRCLESITACTAEPVRLLLIDNGSEPPTRDLLDRFRAEGRIPTEILRNTANLGFIKAVNQGIRSARAPWVCLLNNDTLVTQSWLTELLKVAQADPRIGLVNPTSNSLGFQPGKLSPEEYAAGLRRESGRWTELSIALGFCLHAQRRSWATTTSNGFFRLIRRRQRARPLQSFPFSTRLICACEPMSGGSPSGETKLIQCPSFASSSAAGPRLCGQSGGAPGTAQRILKRRPHFSSNRLRFSSNSFSHPGRWRKLAFSS